MGLFNRGTLLSTPLKKDPRSPSASVYSIIPGAHQPRPSVAQRSSQSCGLRNWVRSWGDSPRSSLLVIAIHV